MNQMLQIWIAQINLNILAIFKRKGTENKKKTVRAINVLERMVLGRNPKRLTKLR
jgi:hypothetical protein